MKVQRVRLPETQHVTWLVLDDNYIPVEPILSYLKFLHNLDRSPNTIRAVAYHLKQFWEYLRDVQITWMEIDIAQLASFITWLRRHDPHVASIEAKPAKRTNATIDQTVGSVHGFYTYHMRIKTIPELPLYQLSMPYHRRYKPFLHGIAKTRPEETRLVSVKREKRLPKMLTGTQVEMLIATCIHTRDKFLLTLLFQTGMRIGQCLGLRHSDLSAEDGTIQIVPRSDNPNGARAKTRNQYSIPVLPDVMQLYTDYLVEDLSALETDALPDFVFVNLFEGEVGRPMTDEWKFTLPNGTHRYMHFSLLISPSLKSELKYALWRKFDSGAWKREQSHLSHCNLLSLLMQWLNIVAPNGSSLLERSLDQWELSLRTYLTKTDQYKRRPRQRLCANQVQSSYMACQRASLRLLALLLRPSRNPHTRSRLRLETLVGQCWHTPVAHQQSNTDQQMSFRNR